MQSADFDRKTLYYAALILAVVFISYFNILTAGFVSDDLFQIVNNPSLRSLKNIPGLFISGVWHNGQFAGALYRPVAMLSWLVEYSIVGARPFLYHLDNVVLHLLCSLMVYFVIKSMLKDEKAALFAALLFAAHPAHTEAVDWIACRMELLYTLFLLVSFYIFITKPANVQNTLSSLFFFVLALLSKETAIVLPVLLALHLLVFTQPESGRTRIGQLSIRLYPYVTASLTYLIYRSIIVGPLGSATNTLYINIEGLTSYEKFLIMCRAFYEYMRLCLFPVNLSAEYMFRPPVSLFEFKELLPVLMPFLTLAFAPRLIRISRPVVAAVFWFYISLIPVSNIIPSGIIMAERELYLPSMGVCALLGLALSKARKRSQAVMLLSAILVIFVSGTVHRNPFWDNERKVQTWAIGAVKRRIELFPYNPESYKLLTRIYLGLGNTGPEPENAIREAVRLDPSDADAHFVFANLYQKRGVPEAALRETQAAIRLKPKAEHYALAGQLLRKLGRTDEAVGMMDEAIRLGPGDAGLYVAKGNILLEAGDDDSAMRLFIEAAKLDPSNPDAYLGQGIVLDSRRDFGAAVEKLKRAVQLKPDSPDMRYFLAVAYVDAGNPVLAGNELREAVRLKPDYKDARSLLEKISHTQP